MKDGYGACGDEYILSPEEIAQFHREGYVTLPAVLSEAELAAIKPVYERFISGGVPGMARDYCDMSGPYDRATEDYSLVKRTSAR